MARDVYEALNEQLTTEIPQLIDLRVPYLDPSFEALVKIQLRCRKPPPSQVTPGIPADRWVHSLCRGLFAHGAGAAVSGPRHARAVCAGASGSACRAGVAGDSRSQHSWCFIEGLSWRRGGSHAAYFIT